MPLPPLLSQSRSLLPASAPVGTIGVQAGVDSINVRWLLAAWASLSSSLCNSPHPVAYFSGTSSAPPSTSAPACLMLRSWSEHLVTSLSVMPSSPHECWAALVSPSSSLSLPCEAASPLSLLSSSSFPSVLDSSITLASSAALCPLHFASWENCAVLYGRGGTKGARTDLFSLGLLPCARSAPAGPPSSEYSAAAGSSGSPRASPRVWHPPRAGEVGSRGPEDSWLTVPSCPLRRRPPTCVVSWSGSGSGSAASASFPAPSSCSGTPSHGRSSMVSDPASSPEHSINSGAASSSGSGSSPASGSLVGSSSRSCWASKSSSGGASAPPSMSSSAWG
mmetsp:Transcript_132979/g.230607  ORF Transcript_132979/g.230607 Transcript_132979/m.230607 type:complete len:335 (-) Transcript_132979:2450-3454(-)